MSTEEGVMRNTARHPTTNNILYVTAVLPTTTAKDMLLCLMTNVTLAWLYSVSSGLVTLKIESQGSSKDHGEYTTTITTIHDLASTSSVSRYYR